LETEFIIKVGSPENSTLVSLRAQEEGFNVDGKQATVKGQQYPFELKFFGTVYDTAARNQMIERITADVDHEVVDG
jgi:hypothetical protein